MTIYHSPDTINANKITDHIWVGNHPCCLDDASKELGIDFDAQINLDDETDTLPLAEGKVYLVLPTPDRTPISVEQTKVGIKALDAMVKSGMEIYIHCKYGAGRSPFLVICYLIIYKGLSLEEAITLLQETRPILDLSDLQMKVLNEYVAAGMLKE